jgi:hypothetical protein
LLNDLSKQVSSEIEDLKRIFPEEMETEIQENLGAEQAEISLWKQKFRKILVQNKLRYLLWKQNSGKSWCRTAEISSMEQKFRKILVQNKLTYFLSCLELIPGKMAKIYHAEPSRRDAY